MSKKPKKRGASPRDLWRLILVAVGVVAVVQQLRQPRAERTWHGQGSVFPYDFRMPTVERVKATYWNPEGSLITSKVFGVGWALNLGAVNRYFGGSRK